MRRLALAACMVLGLGCGGLDAPEADRTGVDLGEIKPGATAVHKPHVNPKAICPGEFTVISTRVTTSLAGESLVYISVADESGAVCDAFGVWGEKAMYGRTYLVIERATFLFGADGTLIRAWRKVKVPGHAQAVLEAVHAL